MDSGEKCDDVNGISEDNAVQSDPDAVCDSDVDEQIDEAYAEGQFRLIIDTCGLG